MTRVVAVAGAKVLTRLLRTAFGDTFPLIDLEVVGAVLRSALRTNASPGPEFRLQFLKERLATFKDPPHVLLVLGLESDEEFAALNEWCSGGAMDKFHVVKDSFEFNQLLLLPDIREVAHINDRQFVQTFDEILSPSSL